ncbi:ABC transporter ATP-binding protein [Pseudogemmobacter sonorensis]|uniref:ABC transporter ATP-binding protein n=1 Tax=Pseudogemmobacter sonorensis TaxID=2989681 RepID=UPI0036790EB6
MATQMKIENLTAGYGKLAVLHDISLEIREGEMLSLIGPNGAGKTSLTRAIMRQCAIMSGRITFEGEVISAMPTHRIAALGIGYVPQSRNVFRSLTVQENLEMSASLVPASRKARAIDEAYERFPRLTERRRQLGSSLSGGERQMLAISSALLMKPRLLVLDEPVSGLSPGMTDEVANGIAAINRSGVTVLWVVEENPQQIIGLSDSVAVMSTGTIRLHQPAAEMLRAENFRELFLGV